MRHKDSEVTFGDNLAQSSIFDDKHRLLPQGHSPLVMQSEHNPNNTNNNNKNVKSGNHLKQPENLSQRVIFPSEDEETAPPVPNNQSQTKKKNRQRLNNTLCYTDLKSNKTAKKINKSLIKATVPVPKKSKANQSFNLTKTSSEMSMAINFSLSLRLMKAKLVKEPQQLEQKLSPNNMPIFDFKEVAHLSLESDDGKIHLNDAVKSFRLTFQNMNDFVWPKGLQCDLFLDKYKGIQNKKTEANVLWSTKLPHDLQAGEQVSLEFPYALNDIESFSKLDFLKKIGYLKVYFSGKYMKEGRFKYKSEKIRVDFKFS